MSRSTSLPSRTSSAWAISPHATRSHSVSRETAMWLDRSLAAVTCPDRQADFIGQCAHTTDKCATPSPVFARFLGWDRGVRYTSDNVRARPEGATAAGDDRR